MLPKSKELYLIKEDLIKKGIYDKNYVKKQEKKLGWGRIEFESKRNRKRENI